MVVIGAGAVGAACASGLARAGRRVRVLSDPARGTTPVSGGHLLLQSKRPGPLLELARRSLELLAAFVAGREGELGYLRRGSLLLARTEADAAALRAHAEALRAEGVPIEWLDGDGARALEPGLGEGLLAASFCPADAQIHPGALAAAWLQDALVHGATLTSGARVESFVTSGGRLCGVVAGGAEYPAEAVVLAAGAWSGELAAMAGARVEIEPRRGILLRAASATPLAGRPLLGAEYLAAKFGAGDAVGFSFQQHPLGEWGGECLLGGSRERVGFSTEGVEALVPRILELGAAYLPAVRGLGPWEPRVGFRPWTPDGLPRIGPCEAPGLYLAAGHEGDGIALAAATAERIVAALT